MVKLGNNKGASAGEISHDHLVQTSTLQGKSKDCSGLKSLSCKQTAELRRWTSKTLKVAKM